MKSILSIVLTLTFMLVYINPVFAVSSGANVFSEQKTASKVVMASTTGVSEFVTRLYQLCLGRNPDPAGLRYWVDTLLIGQYTDADVAYGFVFSNEFMSRNVSDEDYVTIMYNVFLNRNPDPIGYNGWVSTLANGMSRYSAFVGFVNSNEFKVLSASFGIKHGVLTLTQPADLYSQISYVFVPQLPKRSTYLESLVSAKE